MHSRVRHLHDVAVERERHFREIARTAGTPGRREKAERLCKYYGTLVYFLFRAVREAEHTP